MTEAAPPAQPREPSPSRALATGGVQENMPEEIARLVAFVNGCKDDVDGIAAKATLVRSFIVAQKGRADLVDVICWLHLKRAIAVQTTAMLQIIRWQKPKVQKPAVDQHAAVVLDAGRPGLFVASALEACPTVDEMSTVVDRYVAANKNVDVVDVLRYVNRRGFMQIDASALLSTSPLSSSPKVIDWKRPPEEHAQVAAWRRLWSTWADELDAESPRFPLGAPTYINVRDTRGRAAKLAFLGAAVDKGIHRPLATPSDVLLGPVWNLPRPNMCINADAGSMHPRQMDSISRMCHLPQYKEWVAAAAGANQPAAGDAGVAAPEAPETLATDATAKGRRERRQKRRQSRREVLQEGDLVSEGEAVSDPPSSPPKSPPRTIVHVHEVMRKSIQEWHQELQPLNTDEVMGDGSINNLIYTKLKGVFSALLDAANLADSWVVIDRTDGQGSATAEVLLELALERGAQRPTIVAIDSLERLGRAREGSRAQRMLKQLCTMFHDEENASHAPSGAKKELGIDFLYSLGEFDRASAFADNPDEHLPFSVLPEHMSKSHDNACEPNRKWRYHYVDGLFANATHYVLKSNDTDEFDLESLTRTGFLYAHGDSRTYKRLRANIQQGKPVVMLHNSGEVVTAFSWLQRVMAFARPAPPPDALRGPLKFLVSALSNANWVDDFGVPEVIMMRGLAERAPKLFRTHVVSVDIMTDGEEQTLDAIMGCFAASGGVPELGQGDAETNVVFNAWRLHIVLCEQGAAFKRKSVAAQLMIWALALMTTTVAIAVASLGSGHDPKGAVLQRYLNFDAQLTARITTPLGYASLLLPIATAFVSTAMHRLLWRDRWSACHMAATQLLAEIYKYRTLTLEYSSFALTPLPGGEEPAAHVHAKEHKRLARHAFVERIQTIFTCCATEIAQSEAISHKRLVVATSQRHAYRLHQENKPTLAQWLDIKQHVERHCYNTKWTLPPANFLNWASGLQPFLHQRAIRTEFRSVIECFAAKEALMLAVKPLSTTQSRLVRQGLALKLGLRRETLDPHGDELLQLQRQLVKEMVKEQAEEETARATLTAAKRTKKAGRATRRVPALVDDDKFTDAADAMRWHVMELQGLGYGKQESKEEKKQNKKTQGISMAVQEVEDDYLAGQLTGESFVVFRVRPLIEHYEKQAVRLANRLNLYETFTFILNSSGAVLAVVGFYEWVTLTVAVVAVITGVIDFTQLRNQVVSVNLCLRDLQKLIVWWDSLSVVRRRTDDTKSRVVDTTERAVVQVVRQQTTAASSTQLHPKSVYPLSML